jgi:hypothetical protein
MAFKKRLSLSRPRAEMVISRRYVNSPAFQEAPARVALRNSRLSGNSLASARSMGYELRKIRLKLTAKSPADLIDHLRRVSCESLDENITRIYIASFSQRCALERRRCRKLLPIPDPSCYLLFFESGIQESQSLDPDLLPWARVCEEHEGLAVQTNFTVG